MKTLICALLIIILSVFGSVEAIGDSNPDGRIGSVAITCVGGYQTGSGDMSIGNITSMDVFDLSGFVLGAQIEAPTSKQSTLLLQVNFNRQNTSWIQAKEYVKQEWSSIQIVGGFRFFINP